MGVIRQMLGLMGFVGPSFCVQFTHLAHTYIDMCALATHSVWVIIMGSLLIFTVSGGSGWLLSTHTQSVAIAAAAAVRYLVIWRLAVLGGTANGPETPAFCVLSQTWLPSASHLPLTSEAKSTFISQKLRE